MADGRSQGIVSPAVTELAVPGVNGRIIHHLPDVDVEAGVQRAFLVVVVNQPGLRIVENSRRQHMVDAFVIIVGAVKLLQVLPDGHQIDFEVVDAGFRGGDNRLEVTDGLGQRPVLQDNAVGNRTFAAGWVLR